MAGDSHDDHGGLHRDLPHLLDRREALRWMGGVSLAGILAACGVDTSPTSSSAAPTTAPTTPTTALQATLQAVGPPIPDEAAGPFPADGTNGPNALTESGVFKADVTTSFGELTGTADGVPLDLDLLVAEADTGRPIEGAAAYIWQCTADGRYSIYEIADQNYLRGVQIADTNGVVSFRTVFPGCYPGRWPHVHFEIYRSLDEASVGSAAVKTSQLAFPREVSEEVYVDERYGDSADCLDALVLNSDIVFRDGWSDQMVEMAGNPDDRLAATLLVRV